MSTGEQAQAAAAAAATAEAQEVSLLDQVISATKQTERSRAEDLIKTLADEALAGDRHVRQERHQDDQRQRSRRSTRSCRSSSPRSCTIPTSRSWKGPGAGCNYLVMNSETSAMLKIKVLNVSKRELFKDVDKAVEFDQSQIFKKLYENEFGTPGGEPYGALDRRLRVHQPPRGHRPAGQDVQRGRGRVLPVRLGRRPRSCSASRAGTSCPSRATWRRSSTTIEYTKWKSFRDSRGLAVRHPGDAARAVPAALRRRHQADRGVRLRGGRRRSQAGPARRITPG